MIVVNPDDANNTLSFLPRYYEPSSVNISVTLINEDNRSSVTQNLTSITKSEGFISFSTDADFTNNVSYSIKVVENVLNDVIFRGKIFATNQNKQNYSVNG